MENGLRFVHLGKSYSLTTPIDWAFHHNPRANHLDRLAIHYHEFLESVPYDVGLAAVLDWIDHNQWRDKDAWKLGWNCYAISLRAICWMQWLAEFASQLSGRERDKILPSLASQIRYLANNLETDIGGNHLLKNISCLLWAGAYFDDAETDALAQHAEELLSRQLSIQFLQDGMHYELSPAYHCQVFVDLLHCRAAMLATGRSAALVDAKLSSAAQVISDLTHPDGYISLFSDSALMMSYVPSVCLEAYTAVNGASPASRMNFALKNSGYFGQRDAKTYFVADCGPSCADALPAHGHGDILAFEWDVLDKRFIVDAGVFEYESGELRSLSRTAKSHNTVTVGDRDQCEFVGSFRVGRRAHGICDTYSAANGQLVLEGHHDGFSSPTDRVRHRRRFEAQDGGLRVCDTVEGGAGEPAVARLLLHDACQIRQTDSQQYQIERDGIVVDLSTTAANVKINPARWFPNFGEARDTHQIELYYGPAPCAGSFELTLVSTGAA